MLLFHSIYTPLSNTSFKPNSAPVVTVTHPWAFIWPVSAELARKTKHTVQPCLLPHVLKRCQITISKQPSHIVLDAVAPANCAVKLNVTGGMARSWTLISLTKTFTLQRAENTQPLLLRRKRRWANGTVLCRNSHGLELLKIIYIWNHKSQISIIVSHWPLALIWNTKPRVWAN